MVFFTFVCFLHLDLKQEGSAALEHLIRALVPKTNAAVYHDSSEYATNVEIDADAGDSMDGDYFGVEVDIC